MQRTFAVQPEGVGAAACARAVALVDQGHPGIGEGIHLERHLQVNHRKEIEAWTRVHLDVVIHPVELQCVNRVVPREYRRERHRLRKRPSFCSGKMKNNLHPPCFRHGFLYIQNL